MERPRDDHLDRLAGRSLHDGDAVGHGVHDVPISVSRIDQHQLHITVADRLEQLCLTTRQSNAHAGITQQRVAAGAKIPVGGIHHAESGHCEICDEVMPAPGPSAAA